MSHQVITVTQREVPILELAVGDRLPAYVADGRTCDGRQNWTGWTLTFQMRGPIDVTGSTTVVGDNLGTLTYTWGAGETDTPGDYEVVIHGISPSPESKQRTFLVRGVVRIYVP